MPIYEYECKNCSHRFELLRSITASDSDLKCPKCGSHNIDKQLSVPSLLKNRGNTLDTTCCGRTQRCDSPPCSTGERCHRD